MNLRILLATLLMPHAVHAGESASYSLVPDTLDYGGLRGASANYTADFSTTPGGAGSSANYTARTGFAGQLSDAVAAALTASPATVNEGGARQLGASLIFDDLTTTPLAAGSVTWSMQGGPLTGVSATGLATTASVYQDSSAMVQGTYQSFTGTLHLTILNTNPNNFGAYANDGFDDAWQVRYFGLNNPDAAATANPDGDPFDNLLEFAFGTAPNDSASGIGSIAYSGGFISARGQPAVSATHTATGMEFRAAFGRRKDYAAARLTYTVQFSADLIGWESSTVTPTVVASDAEIEAVTVPYPFSLSTGSKARFFRVQVTGP